MDNDTSTRETCKNISQLPGGTTESDVGRSLIGGDSDGIHALPFQIVEGDDGEVARAVTGTSFKRVDPSPSKQSQSAVRRLQTLLANVENIERNKKSRPPARLTPKGQFAGPARYKPAYLDELGEISEPTPQDFRDHRRLSLNLSQEQCSKLLRLHKGTIVGWERGLRRIPFSAYLVLCLLSEPRSGESSLVRETRSSESAVGEYIPKSEPLLPVPLDQQRGFIPRRERAAKMTLRMHRFSKIYNAAWHVRDAFFQGEDRKKMSAEAFVEVLMQELWNCKDPEALIYAVAHSLTLSPHGVPWES